jgi:serine/threonine-protein kinase
LGEALVSDTLERLRLVLADRYAIERELGRGGMATVYLAQDIRHDRRVAIKVLRPELSVSLGGERFNREIKVAAALQHPHILGLYDSGAADGVLYYVMPFVEGESLRDKLDREKQLGVEEAIRLVCEAADALQYAHSRGVIHRDIKPENIMLSGGHSLVADFGIAKAFSEAGGAKLTETGMAVGTPYYMSPEQAMGSDIDARADQYSLACVLYELLAGQPPFTGPTPMAILARHSLEQVPRLTIVRHSIPDAVEAIVLRALGKVPADRYPTMLAFRDALLEADLGPLATRTGARPIPTQSIRAPARPRPAWRRALPWVGGAVALVLVAVAGVAGWHRWGPGRNPSAADSGAAGLDPKHLAVMYFRSEGSTDSLRFLADGLTEALIHELSQVKALQVISRNGVSPYKKTDVSPDSIGRALRVGTLVEGTLAQSGGRLRVSVALVSAATGTELGSKTIERPREEIFALQDDLAKEVALFLRAQLGEEVQLRERRAETKNVPAWETLQRAQEEVRDADALGAAADSAGATRAYGRADSLLAQAEQLDPRWATPPTIRGWLLFRQSRLALSAPPAYHSDLIRRGLAFAQRGLELRPDDADALELRGTLKYWKWLSNLAEPKEAASLFAEAERDLRASVTANPSQASAWTTLGHLLLNKPRSTAEAKLAALRAYEADPYLTNANVTLWRLFSTSFDLDDAVEANRWCEEGQRRFPKDYRFVECQLWYFRLKGVKPDIPRAWHLLNQYVEASPPGLRELNSHKGQMYVAAALARAGAADSARAVATRARADATLDPGREVAYFETVARLIVGDKDEAFQQFSAYLASNPQRREALADDDSWELRDLRADPRFAALTGR